MTVTKKVKLKLAGLDGNSFVLVGAFRKAARRENWTEKEIDKVTDEAMSGNYNNLLNVLARYTESPD